jgi:Flp pilus assembly protein TadG
MSMRLPAIITNCRGTAVIEMAFALPTLLLFFLGVVEFGRMLWMQTTLQQAVEGASRCAVVNTSTCDNAADTQSYAVSQVTGFTVANSAFTANLTTTCGSGISGSQVSVSLPFQFVVPMLFPWNVTLTAESCHPT